MINIVSFLAQNPIGTVTAPGGLFIVPENQGNETVSRILGAVLTLLVVVGVIYIILSALKYITAQGDQKKIQEAQSGITNTIIGLVIAFVSYFIVLWVLTALGFGGAVQDF